MSRSNNPWMQFHQTNHPTTVQTFSGDTAATDAPTVVTSPNPTAPSQLNRVTRPTITRRRSRASRKTPTTLLNTDTANFRAMVQRFTGGGNSGGDPTSVPFPSHEYPVTSIPHVINTYNSLSSGFSDGLLPNVSYDLEFRPPNNRPYFTMVGDSGGSTAAHYDDDADADDQRMGFRETGSFNW